MKTVIDGNMLILQNFNRIDESELFRQATGKLRRAEEIRIEDKQIGPDCEIVTGDCAGIAFSLILDADYGAVIKCSSSKCLKRLQNILAS